MGEVNLSIKGKTYGIACDPGQEARVAELGKYVDARVREIAGAGAASNDAHLLVLTAIVLADEIYELREQMGRMMPMSAVNESVPQLVSPEEERQIIEAIEHLAVRIDSVAERLEKIA